MMTAHSSAAPLPGTEPPPPPPPPLWTTVKPRDVALVRSLLAAGANRNDEAQASPLAGAFRSPLHFACIYMCGGAASAESGPTSTTGEKSMS